MTESAGRGTIDDVIMPHATRSPIARAFAMLLGKTVQMPGASTIIRRCDYGLNYVFCPDNQSERSPD